MLNASHLVLCEPPSPAPSSSLLPVPQVRELEASWGLTFEPGYDESLSFMAHLWQPLQCQYRCAECGARGGSCWP